VAPKVERRLHLPGGVGRLVRAARAQVVAVEKAEIAHRMVCPVCQAWFAGHGGGLTAGLRTCEIAGDLFASAWQWAYRFRAALEWFLELTPDAPGFLRAEVQAAKDQGEATP
jgi:hypothetical protein